MSDLNYAMINLVNDPSYTFTATCFEQTLTFVVTWSERAKKRSISVRGGNGDIYLMNTFINVDEPVEFNINAIGANYPCSLVLLRKTDGSQLVDYYRWADNMFLTVYKVTEE